MLPGRPLCSCTAPTKQMWISVQSHRIRAHRTQARVKVGDDSQQDARFAHLFQGVCRPWRKVPGLCGENIKKKEGDCWVAGWPSVPASVCKELRPVCETELSAQGRRPRVQGCRALPTWTRIVLVHLQVQNKVQSSEGVVGLVHSTYQNFF